jgi:preprotein translocase subunit SecB
MDLLSEQDLTIHNIYAKDVSFESPNTPQIFSLPWEPKVDFDLAINSENIAENVWEVILAVTIKVAVKLTAEQQAANAAQQAEAQKVKTNEPSNKASGNKEFETAFLAEVKLAGIFTIAGLAKAKTDMILATTIPTILFPYLREMISSLIAKGGFPQLILPPMDFNAMYQKHLADQTKAPN